MNVPLDVIFLTVKDIGCPDTLICINLMAHRDHNTATIASGGRLQDDRLWPEAPPSSL
jgi:hypothetical protein